MVGREFVGDTLVKYRYGMNTQEKDDEIYGKGNASSAEFWEYDTRLVRRWNLDPVPKKWESSYACLSNSPIWRIDPNGDDDFFNADGSFSRHTNTKTNNIYIATTVNKVTTNTPLSNYKFELAKDKKTGTSKTNTMIGNIANHYTGDKDKYSVKKDEGYAAYNIETGVINISLDAKGNVNNLLNDANNLKSLLFHEKLHKNFKGKDDSNLFNPKGTRDHIGVYFAQLQDKSFTNTTLDFKKDQIKKLEGYIDYLDGVTTKKPGTSTKEATDMRTKLDGIKKKYEI